MNSPISRCTTIVETAAERRRRKFEEWAAGEKSMGQGDPVSRRDYSGRETQDPGVAAWEEMQENAQKCLGESVDELFQKAITNPAALTFAEYQLVRDDFRVLKRVESVDYSARKLGRARRPDLQENWKAACAAVLSQEEQQDLRNMGPEKYHTLQEMHYAANREAHQKAITVPPDWVKKILEREDKAWGYIIYHPQILPDDKHAIELWDEFQVALNGTLLDQPVRVTGSDQINDSKILDFVPFERRGDDDEVDQLRRDFRNRRETGSLNPGVMTNVFIFASEECQASHRDAEFPWLWAIDPDWLTSGPDEDGYDERVKIAWVMLYTKFYDFISTNRFTVKDIWRDYHRMNQQFRDGPSPAWLWTELDRPVWPDC